MVRILSGARRARQERRSSGNAPASGSPTPVNGRACEDNGERSSLHAGRTTRALNATRVAEVDLPALVRRYAALDGRAFGDLSGRGEATGTIDGATSVVDYGLPAKSGREIFGALIPCGQVWRTGANRATHLTTDRDLRIGGTAGPAGSYTLFTFPRAEGWTLIVNRRTEITGTAHDPAHDLPRGCDGKAAATACCWLRTRPQPASASGRLSSVRQSAGSSLVSGPTT